MIVGVLLRRLDDGEGSFAEVSAAIDRLELLDPPSTWLWSDPQKRFGALLGATPISTTSSTRSGEDAAPARPLPRAAWRRRWLWRGDPTKGHGQHALATHANPLAHATRPPLDTRRQTPRPRRASAVSVDEQAKPCCGSEPQADHVQRPISRRSEPHQYERHPSTVLSGGALKAAERTLCSAMSAYVELGYSGCPARRSSARREWMSRTLCR